MTEYEWEKPRIPRANGGSGAVPLLRTLRPIDHFVALECPRESVAWVLNGPSNAEASPRQGASTPKVKLREGAASA